MNKVLTIGCAALVLATGSISIYNGDYSLAHWKFLVAYLLLTQEIQA